MSPTRSHSGSRTALACALVSLVAAATSTTAQEPPGAHLSIREVHVGSAPPSLTIRGEHLDFGRDTKVTLAGLGEITESCTLDSPTQISCDLSASGLPAPGDYLLTVSGGNGQSQSDRYGLTVGSGGGTGPGGGLQLLGFYTVSQTSAPAGGGDERLTTEALCNSGDPVVGGGFEYELAPGPLAVTIRDVTNRPNDAGTGWIAELQRGHSAGTTLTVHARCANLGP